MGGERKKNKNLTSRREWIREGQDKSLKETKVVRRRCIVLSYQKAKKVASRKLIRRGEKRGGLI